MNTYLDLQSLFIFIAEILHELLHQQPQIYPLLNLLLNIQFLLVNLVESNDCLIREVETIYFDDLVHLTILVKLGKNPVNQYHGLFTLYFVEMFVLFLFAFTL